MTVHTIDLHFSGQQQAIAAFVVPTSAGPVLVETGPHATLNHLEQGLNQLGYQLKDIQHVLLSHIHLDHAGASWYFARQGATIYVHPKGVKHLASPERLMQSAKRIYQDQMDTLWGQMHPIDAQRMVAPDHGQDIVIGDATFTAHYTPGHAVHHIAWQLGSNLFTGDVAGVCIPGGPVVAPCPPPDIHLEHWQQSINLIKNLPVNTLYLTHYGPVTDIENHLSALQQALTDWGAWVRQAMDRGLDAPTMTPQFQQYVQQQLQQQGVSGQQLMVYEAANPSWMSVAGLMRYWQKKNENVN